MVSDTESFRGFVVLVISTPANSTGPVFGPFSTDILFLERVIMSEWKNQSRDHSIGILISSPHFLPGTQLESPHFLNIVKTPVIARKPGGGGGIWCTLGSMGVLGNGEELGISYRRRRALGLEE